MTSQREFRLDLVLSPRVLVIPQTEHKGKREIESNHLAIPISLLVTQIVLIAAMQMPLDSERCGLPGNTQLGRKTHPLLESSSIEN